MGGWVANGNRRAGPPDPYEWREEVRALFTVPDRSCQS